MNSYRFALVIHIIFDRWCLPHFIIILGHIQVCALLQRVLNHQVIVFEFQVLKTRSVSW